MCAKLRDSQEGIANLPDVAAYIERRAKRLSNRLVVIPNQDNPFFSEKIKPSIEDDDWKILLDSVAEGFKQPNTLLHLDYNEGRCDYGYQEGVKPFQHVVIKNRHSTYTLRKKGDNLEQLELYITDNRTHYTRKSEYLQNQDSSVYQEISDFIIASVKDFRHALHNNIRGWQQRQAERNSDGCCIMM